MREYRFHVMCGLRKIVVLRATCLVYSVCDFYVEGPLSKERAF